MPNLHEQDCEVVNEDEGGGEAVRELDNVVVGHSPPLLAGNNLEVAEKPLVRSGTFRGRISRKCSNEQTSSFQFMFLIHVF